VQPRFNGDGEGCLLGGDEYLSNIGACCGEDDLILYAHAGHAYMMLHAVGRVYDAYDVACDGQLSCGDLVFSVGLDAIWFGTPNKNIKVSFGKRSLPKTHYQTSLLGLAYATAHPEAEVGRQAAEIEAGALWTGTAKRA